MANRVRSSFTVPLGFGDASTEAVSAPAGSAVGSPLAPATPSPVKSLTSYFFFAVAAGVAVWWVTQKLGGKRGRRYSGGPRIVHSHFVESDGPDDEDEDQEDDEDVIDNEEEEEN